MKTPLTTLSAVAACLVLGACGSSDKNPTAAPAASGDGGSGAKSIPIKDFKYVPDSLTVKSGTKVTWTNEDTSPHTATADGALAFDTGTLTKGASKTLTLKQVGTYTYICKFHPFMKATITVVK